MGLKGFNDWLGKALKEIFGPIYYVEQLWFCLQFCVGASKYYSVTDLDQLGLSLAIYGQKLSAWFICDNS